MTDREWEQFFDLLHQITNLKMPFEEKKNLLLTKAEENSADVDLEEVSSWLEGVY